MGEMTCTGWDVTDNKFYGSNGYLFEGDSEPELAHNNRFFSSSTTPAAATTPEVASIYAWQKANANTARLVISVDRRTVTDTGGTTDGVVTRVKAATGSSLTVNLSTDIAGLSVPASVTIPAGQTSANFTITGAAISGGEKAVTLTAAASGLMPDTEKISVLDQDAAQPNFGGFKWPAPVAGLPEFWKVGNYGIVTIAGSQSYNSGTDTWTLTGGGVTAVTSHASLSRSGRRFLYQSVDGDGEIRARITSTTGESQVGLMIADDEANHTDFIWVEPTGRVLHSSNNASNGLGNGPVFQAAAAGAKVVPCWLRLKRVGSTFTAYRSTAANPSSEGDWTVLATVDLYTPTTHDYKSPAILDSRMHYGMFINSSTAVTTATATFTGVNVQGAIVGIVPPGTPGDLAANLVGTTANLTWTDTATDETGFQLEVNTGTGGWQLLATLPANTTSYAHNGVLDGVTYSYRIRSTRASPEGYSPYSNIATVSRPTSTTPLAPTSLTANGVSVSEVQLTWVDNAYNETGYTVERSLTPGGGYSVIATLAANVTGITDAGRPEGSRLYYRVRALNGIGNSGYSNEAVGTTILLPPDSAYAAETSTTQITLNWTDVSTAELGYSIERRPSGSGEFTVLGTTGPNATTFTDTTVVAGTAYLYRIRSFNAVTQSVYTGEIQATADVETFSTCYEPFDYDPNVSSSVVGQFGSGRGTSGIWSRIAGNNPVDALQSGSLSSGGVTTLGNHLRLGETSANSRISISLNNITRDVIYPTAGGARTFWVSFLCRTPSTLSGSYTPGFSLATATNSDVLHFQTWTGDADRRFSIAGTGLTTVNSANSTVAASTTYLYVAKVTIGDTNGNAADGVESVSATIWQFPAGSNPPTTPPSEASGLTRTETAIPSSIITKLTLHGANSGTSNAFSFDELRIGKSYPQVAITTPAAALGRPQNLTATHLTGGVIRLRWLDNANNETGCQIERRLGVGGAWSLIATTAANVVICDDTPPAAGQEYFYRVRAVNGGGQGEWSEVVPILTEGTYTDPASISHSQQTNRITAIPVTLYNRASVDQAFAVTAASGGANYALATSAQPGGPTFTWADISSTGTVITSLNGADDSTSTEQVPIGFSFPFYGNTFTTFRVSSNGWLSFDASVSGSMTGHFNNQPLPYTQDYLTNVNRWLPPSAIAFLWDDLYFQNSAPVSRAYYRQVDADTLVLQFSNVGLYSDSSARLNLQVHLKRSGDILIYYKDGSLNAHSYTIGIQNATRTVAVQAAHNSEYVSTNMALRFRPPAPWLTSAPSSLSIPANGAAQFVATLNSTGMANGTYTSSIRILSDQPRQPAVEVPVTMIVSASSNAPLAPTNLVASSTAGAVTLSWTDHATNETGYEVQRSLDQITWLVWATLPANATSAGDTSGTTGTLYFRVRATGSPTHSPWSPTASLTLSAIPTTGLQNFRTTHGLATNGSQDAATPAGDGVANLLKYAFNMIGGGAGQAANLTTPNASVLAPGGIAGLPMVGMDGTGRLQITYIRRKASSNSGITYTVEWSTTMSSWATDGSAAENVTSLDSTFERVTLTDSATFGRRFVRVKTSTP
jgi:hypothetical protein